MTNTRTRKQKPSETALQANRAVIYLRVSTDEQAKYGHGLDAQLESSQAFAALHGYVVVDTLTDDGLSGTLPMTHRAAITQAITMGVMGQADTIIAYAQDRYARDTEVWATIRKAATKAGMKLLTVKEGQDFTSKESEFMGDIHAAVAAQERRTIAERLYGGRRQKAMRDGRGSGFVPYGYTRYKRVENDRVVSWVEIDETAAAAVRLMIAARGEGKSYQAIADMLTEQGYEKPKGGCGWSFGNVQQLLQNERLYRTGVRVWDDVTSTELWPIIAK